MIQLTHQTRILLGIAPADFRRGIDGFAAICQNQLLLDPRDQSVFVFINKARTMIRALSYDGSGYWLMTKRLSRGKFQGWPSGDSAVSYTPHYSFAAFWAVPAGRALSRSHRYLPMPVNRLRLVFITRQLTLRDTFQTDFA